MSYDEWIKNMLKNQKTNLNKARKKYKIINRDYSSLIQGGHDSHNDGISLEEVAQHDYQKIMSDWRAVGRDMSKLISYKE